jgi:hypothetical protein
MNPVVAMAGASVASVLVAGALVEPGTRLAVLLGMLGPLLATTSSWVVIERTYRESRQKLTNVMIVAFAFKLVFFGFYVGLMIRVVALRPLPFVASFTGFFVGLYLMEALYLRRLFR